MRYSIVVANGESSYECKVSEVEQVIIEEGIYKLYGKKGVLLFSTPQDSLVYMVSA